MTETLHVKLHPSKMYTLSIDNVTLFKGKV